MTTGEKSTAGCVLMIAGLPLGVALNGYALSVLWEWFVVPVFHLPLLGIAQAIGLSMVAGMLTHQTMPDDKSKEWWEPIGLVFITPLLSLLFGDILRYWI